MDGEVEGIGAVEGEDEMVGVLAVEKLIKPFTTLPNDLSGQFRFRIGTAASGCTAVIGVLLHGGDNGWRLWKAGGGVIKINAVVRHYGFNLCGYTYTPA